MQYHKFTRNLGTSKLYPKKAKPVPFHLRLVQHVSHLWCLFWYWYWLLVTHTYNRIQHTTCNTHTVTDSDSDYYRVNVILYEREAHLTSHIKNHELKNRVVFFLLFSSFGWTQKFYFFFFFACINKLVLVLVLQL